jgi:biopolymer transport protein ExbD
MAIGNHNDDMLSEINVTPLVDVMLVLLVVFIITAPLLAPQALKVNLPKTDAVQAAAPKQPLQLTVDALGGVALGDMHISDAGLADALKNRASEPDFQLTIEADKSVPYGRIAELMALAQHAGVARLSFVTLAR